VRENPRDDQRLLGTGNDLELATAAGTALDLHAEHALQAPRTAGRAETALLTTERHELLRMAVLAAHAQEALLQPAALEICLELFLHVVRQWPTDLDAQLAEAGILPLEQLVQQRALQGC
jgi:hypothetical protein